MMVSGSKGKILESKVDSDSEFNAVQEMWIMGA